MWKEKELYTEGIKIYVKDVSFICEIVKKEKDIHASLALTLQTAKVMATVRDKCLVKMEKGLKLYDKVF